MKTSLQFKHYKPNVEIDWLAFLLPFREVSGYNIGPETGNPDYFRGYPPTLQTNAMIASQFRPGFLPSTSFPIPYSRIILPFEGIHS
jgi:hypothetical protein